MNKTAINICMKILPFTFWHIFLFLCSNSLGIDCWFICQAYKFTRNDHIFLQSGCIISHFQQQYEGLSWSTYLSTFGVVEVFHFCHCSRGEVKSVVLVCIFLITNDVEWLFLCLLIILCEESNQIFDHF